MTGQPAVDFCWLPACPTCGTVLPLVLLSDY